MGLIDGNVGVIYSFYITINKGFWKILHDKSKNTISRYVRYIHTVCTIVRTAFGM